MPDSTAEKWRRHIRFNLNVTRAQRMDVLAPQKESAFAEPRTATPRTTTPRATTLRTTRMRWHARGTQPEVRSDAQTHEEAKPLKNLHYRTG
jgi:heme-binding NEAT domain protein